mmetsp:Transcript_26592/g.103509  ORF Transcript_26592/g.103509 Transcript_26592/m.103509 type:complete len:200 (+) Transcript_26592:1501-2100(+)
MLTIPLESEVGHVVAKYVLPYMTRFALNHLLSIIMINSADAAEDLLQPRPSSSRFTIHNVLPQHRHRCVHATAIRARVLLSQGSAAFVLFTCKDRIVFRLWAPLSRFPFSLLCLLPLNPARFYYLRDTFLIFIQVFQPCQRQGKTLLTSCPLTTNTILLTSFQSYPRPSQHFPRHRSINHLQSSKILLLAPLLTTTPHH